MTTYSGIVKFGRLRKVVLSRNSGSGGLGYGVMAKGRSIRILQAGGVQKRVASEIYVSPAAAWNAELPLAEGPKNPMLLRR